MAIDAFGNYVPDVPPGTGELPPLLAAGSSGESKIDPALRPYLERGLQRAEQLFFGVQPSLYPGQMFVGPSAQTQAALAQQEAIASQASPILQQAQQAYLSGLGATSVASPLYQSIYGAAGARPGMGIYEQAAGGAFAPSTARLESLYGQAGGVPSLYGEVAGGARATPTGYLSGLMRQAGAQPAAGLYGQVAGGGFQNLALPGTAQTAAGSFLTGSPYQQALIESAVRPITKQLTESALPGIQSAFSQAGRYGSGAQARAIESAVEAASRAAGDVATQIGAQTYAQERGLQEAARSQLAGLSQQDLANRLAAAGALQTGQQSAIAQQAGLFGQRAGIQQQNLATQLQAAQMAEATRQAQLAQQAGLAGQIAGLQQQDVATRLAGAGGLEQAQQAALATQMAAAQGLGATQAQDITRQLAAAQAAPSFFQMGFLPSQALGQVGAQREAIAAQPLQEQMQRYQFQQQLPYSQLQSYLSSVYGTPMASSVYPTQPTYQNRTMNTLAGAGLGYAGGQALGSFLGGTPFSLTNPSGYGLVGGGLGGLLGGGFF